MDATTTKDEMFSILLNLRTKSIKGEPVKARLKAQNAPTSLASFVPSHVANNVDGGSFLSSLARTTSDVQQQQQQQTQRSPHIGKLSNPSGNKIYHQSRHQVSADAVSEKNPARKPFGVKETGGSKSHRSHGRNKRATHNHTQLDGYGKESYENGGTAFSQFGEKDFPSLGVTSSKEPPQKGSSHENDVQDFDAAKVLKPHSTPPKAMSGYAAALLKPAPINPPIQSENSSVSSMSNVESKVR